MDGALSELLGEYAVCRNTFFFDEFLDLFPLSERPETWRSGKRTMSSVFLALSLTNGLAIIGIFSDATGCFPSGLTIRFSENLLFCSDDIVADDI